MIHDERIIAESKKRYALQTERNAFLDGVQYCEDNPAWRMCEDELPYSNEEVFVVFENGDRGIGYYEGIGDWYVNGIGAVDNVVAWHPLPVFTTKRETK